MLAFSAVTADGKLVRGEGEDRGLVAVPSGEGTHLAYVSVFRVEGAEVTTTFDAGDMHAIPPKDRARIRMEADYGALEAIGIVTDSIRFDV